MSKLSYEVGDRVIINLPHDKKYHGLVAEIEEIDPADRLGFVYTLSLFNKLGQKMRIRLLLKENMIRRFRQRTLYELEPGDVIVNRQGLEFQVHEPLAPVYFISPIATPNSSFQISAIELASDGFTVKKVNNG